MGRREELRSMQEAWRAYLDVALGFTEASRKRAMKVAKKLVGRGGATAEQLQSMAEDLVSTSVANRESMVRLVRFELDRALGRVGLATAEEVSQLTNRVRELEEELRLAHSGAGPAVVTAADDELAASAVAATPAVPATPMAPTPPAKVVRKAVAKKAVAGANGAAPAKTAPAKAAAPAKTTTAKAAPPAKVASPTKGISPARAAALAKAATTTDATPAALAKSTAAKAAQTRAVAKKTAAKTTAKKDTPARGGDGGTTGTQP